MNDVLKKVLKRFFSKTIIVLQDEAVNEYARFDKQSLLENALHGYPFYIRGNTGKDGKHTLYKFVPTDLGKHQTVLLRPNGKSQKVMWNEGDMIEA